LRLSYRFESAEGETYERLNAENLAKLDYLFHLYSSNIIVDVSRKENHFDSHRDFILSLIQSHYGKLEHYDGESYEEFILRKEKEKSVLEELNLLQFEICPKKFKKIAENTTLDSLHEYATKDLLFLLNYCRQILLYRKLKFRYPEHQLRTNDNSLDEMYINLENASNEYPFIKKFQMEVYNSY
jgi:hypothetical protein